MDDRQLLQLTARDERTIGCPICPFTVDVPPVPISDQLGAVFGLSGETLARVHGDQNLKRAVHEFRIHLSRHDVDEWFEQLHQTRVALAEQISMWAEVQEVRRAHS